MFTLTLACSLARVEITLPRLAAQMSAPCPFHEQSPQPAENSGQSSPTEKKKSCPNCLSESIRDEERVQIHADLLASAIILATPDFDALSGAAASFVAAEFVDIRSGAPPSALLPLRI